MLVSRQNFNEVLRTLQDTPRKSLDTETTGLRPYHGDQLFSIIIATAVDAYYFNFNQYPDLSENYVLPDEWLEAFQPLLDPEDFLWYFHNAKFDLAMLANAGLELHGKIWCLKVVERVIDNDLPPGSYDLAKIAQRRGFRKDDTVERYIWANKLWEYRYNATGRYKHPFYNQVPWKLMVPYGEKDGRITYDIGEYQQRQVDSLDTNLKVGIPRIRPVVENECRLLPHVFAMEQRGVLINDEFCKDAIEHNLKIVDQNKQQFKTCTGEEYKKSNPLFQKIFIDEKHKWGKTKPTKTKPHGGVSFDKETVLPKLKHPAAKLIIDISEAQSNVNYFKGFLYQADKDGVIHTHFNQDGADTGRFSSSEPNLQNLKRVDKDVELPRFHVRRAIVPRPGHTFVMIDYDQFQYRLMLDYANARSLIHRILNEGVDVHQATADVAGIDRYSAKTTNFSILFGAGLDLLATNLGVHRTKAKQIKDSVFRAAPEILHFVRNTESTARTRGWVFNWFGRRYKFPNPRAAFTAANKIIQGGEADVMKVGMIEVAEFLEEILAWLVLMIHDEIVLEVKREFMEEIKPVQGILEGIYPHRHLPMTVGVSHSFHSLADKTEGWPDG